MKKISENNIIIMNKKTNDTSQKQNKSSLETNRTKSSIIKQSDNLYGKNFPKKFINKILYSKYNISPKAHDMILLENVVQSKYCHDLAVFKEKILFNYNEEFLRRFYNIEESNSRIPKFVVYYKNYLVFFCKPIFSELNLNELLQAYSEKKAQIFYNENYKDDITNDKKEKKNYFTLFTPKIRKLISNNNSLSNLTINNINPKNESTISSMENSVIKILSDLTMKKNPVKINKNLPIYKDKKIIQGKNISKIFIKNLNPDNTRKNKNNSNSRNKKTIKNNSLGKNLFFIYNQNFKKIISNHNHTKTGTNLNLFKEKVFSERGNSKKKFSNSKISFSKNKKKRSRNLIISHPQCTDLGIYSYRIEKNNQNQKKLNNTNYHTINYANLIDKKQNLRCITERNNKNLVKVIKKNDSKEKKINQNSLSRNANKNSFYFAKGNLNLNILSSAFLKGKNENDFINELILKTDYYNEKNNQIKRKLNFKINNIQIKNCIQTQKKKIKK